MSVVTRFAPSPTGYLHIGGARTALFNWLFAKRHDGAFLLRIEDTDRVRSTPEAIAAIIDGLHWLGLDAAAPPVFQSQRAGRHQEAAQALIARGAAFRCYVTAAELEARRTQAEAAREKLAAARQDKDCPAATLQRLQDEAERLTQAFRSPYRDGAAPPHADAPFVVRLRAPDAGEILNEDLVQGPVRVRAQDLDDLVLLRADGAPTYMLAVVVDDHDMEITHVIRGDDHLTNAARQIPIYRGMGWNPPVFAHIPLIHGPDGAKLSKRHGALAVQAYRDMGYLPEGLLAYLMRLGWSAGEREVERLEEGLALFDLAGVGRGPARLDFDKLASINGRAMQEAEDGRLLALLLDIARTREGYPTDAAAAARICAALPLLKSRTKTIVELADLAHVFVAPRPLALEPGAASQLTPEARLRLGRLQQCLRGLAEWSAPAIGAGLKAFAAGEGVGMGKIGPAVRAALTGGRPAPDLADVMSVLGREETLARLGDHLVEHSSSA